MDSLTGLIVRLTQMQTRIELIDMSDPNLKAIFASMDMLYAAGLSGENIPYGDVGLAYIAGRLRGRQEWTMKVGDNE